MAKKTLNALKSKQLSFSICLPVYKGSHLLKNSLRSILKQQFQSDYEIIIGDDNPPDKKTEIKKTQDVIASFNDKRIKYFKNSKNLGYPKNLRKIVSKAKKDVIFLMAQDDILARDAFQKTHDAFFLDKNIGAVTRPYFWFEKDIDKPVRAVSPPDPCNDLVLSIFDGDSAVRAIFGSIGQLSGLAYRRKLLTVPFHDDVFPAHIYPFAGLLRKHKCVFLKDYTVAVGIRDSQARKVSRIYEKSPTQAWVEMFQTVYADKRYAKIRGMCIKHIVTHYTGLLQLKNFAPKGALQREIALLMRYRWQNILHPKFWMYTFITVLTPRKALIYFVDYYKRFVHSKTLPKIQFDV